MNTFEVRTEYSHCEDCVLIANRYMTNDHIAISVNSLSEGPFANVTVNIDGVEMYPKNYGCVDTNNFPEAVDLIEHLGIGKSTGLLIGSGFCLYPLYEFDEEAIKKYEWRKPKHGRS